MKKPGSKSAAACSAKNVPVGRITTPSLISRGGGIYSRLDKTIPISAELRKWLGIDDEQLTPNKLIRELLKAPVDLLWNGGIGTYVKASTESHAEVGDLANNAVRINGRELRCKVIGEGGNLGSYPAGAVLSLPRPVAESIRTLLTTPPELIPLITRST